MRFGTSWNDLGLILEPLGGVLAASWGHLGEFLKPTSEHLGSQLGYKHFVTCFFGSCVYLGASGGDLGCVFGTSWSDLGLILEPFGRVLAASWGHLGEFLEPTSEHLGSQLGYKHFVTFFFGSVRACEHFDESVVLEQ